MSQRETMRRLAAQEAVQWEDEGQTDSEDQSGSPDHLTVMGRQLKELDARQARIETHLIKLMPSARKAEEQFATIVLAGKELRDEIREHRTDIATSLAQHREQVTATAGQIGGEFQNQLEILQAFFNGVLKLSEKNEQLVSRCQDMVATSSGIYQKGSAGVSEMSEKTQAHLKATAETHRKGIEAQAEHFESVFRRLSKLLIVGTLLILMTACVVGALTGAMWVTIKVQSCGNDGTVELRNTHAAKIHTAVSSGVLPNVLPEDGGFLARQSSAVDEVVKKLWNGFSLSDDAVGNSATVHTRMDRATETGNSPKRPASVVHTKTPELEATSPQPHSSPETAKDCSDSLQAQSPSDKQNRDDGERIRQGGRGRSR